MYLYGISNVFFIYSKYILVLFFTECKYLLIYEIHLQAVKPRYLMFELERKTGELSFI